jgi:hypothetical protein
VGVAVFNFNLGTAINAYLLQHPGTKDVSNWVFISQIASAPIGFSLLYFGWNVFQNRTKTRAFSRNAFTRFLREAFEILSRTMRYGATFESLSLDLIKIPGSWASLLTPIIPAFGIALLEYTPIKRQASFAMTGLMTANLIFLLADETIRHQFPEVENYIRIAYWGVLTGAGIGVIVNKYRTFMEQYDPDAQIVISNPSNERPYVTVNETTPLKFENVESEATTVQTTLAINSSQADSNTGTGKAMLTQFNSRNFIQDQYAANAEVPENKTLKKAWYSNCNLM